MKQRERARWLDGPGFARWLERKGVTPGMVEPSHSTMSKWRNGRGVSERKADDLLVSLGWHLSEIPDSLWVKGPTRRRWSEDVRAKCLAEYAQGTPSLSISQAHGPTSETIRKWAYFAGVKHGSAA